MLLCMIIFSPWNCKAVIVECVDFVGTIYICFLSFLVSLLILEFCIQYRISLNIEMIYRKVIDSLFKVDIWCVCNCVSLCMFSAPICVCTCVYQCICACVDISVEARGVHWVSFSNTFHVIERGGSVIGPGTCSISNWLSSKPQGNSFIHLPSLGITGIPCCAQISNGFWGLKCRSSNMVGIKHFTN